VGRITHVAPRTGNYTCPVCGGKGSCTRRFNPANECLCDLCQGMGSIAEKDDLFRTRNRIVRKKCPKCAGRGLLPLKHQKP
jgi:DnaJ-class molecular chaperone